ncbi:hypothetical protein ADL26_13910, partial [Thermoactinomyces vulgaris]
RAHRAGLRDALAEDVEPFGADLRGVVGAVVQRSPGLHKGAPGAHDGGGVAVHPHDRRVVEDLEQHVEVEQVERGLEHPALARLLPLQHLEDAFEVRVVLGVVALGAPGPVALERPGHVPQEAVEGQEEHA